MRIASILFAFLTALTAPPAISKPPTLVITDVTVVPADTDEVLAHRTLTIVDGVIFRIEPANEAHIAEGVTQIDGRGKYLIPGLVDAHLHITTEASIRNDPDLKNVATRLGRKDSYNRLVLMTLLKAGVTSAFNLGGSEAGDRDLLRLRDDIAAGSILGPRLYVGKRINGPYSSVNPAELAHAPTSNVKAPWNAADGAAAVAKARADGYDFIKPYQYLNRETYTAVVGEAAKLGMLTTGHLPELGCAVCVDQAYVFAHPMNNIAHAEELQRYGQQGELAPSEIDRLVNMVVAARMSVTPTLVTFKSIQYQYQMRQVPTVPTHWLSRLDPASAEEWKAPLNRYLSEKFRHRDHATEFSAAYDFTRVLTRQLWKRGVMLTVGTDAPLPGLIYGYSVHQEMIELGEIGLSPFEVLRAASVNGHRLIDPRGARGAVRVGQRADLVLLDADPITDLQNISNIAGVVVNGVWLATEQINKLLDDYR
ncbi:MAG: amidohydrolase family protein [Pseudomonadota bacterium]